MSLFDPTVDTTAVTKGNYGSESDRRAVRAEQARQRNSVLTMSDLAARPEAVWARVTTPAGINDELRPVLRMTIPKGLRGTTLDDVPVGRPLGRSWILLFGIVPVDYDDICLEEVGERRFLERSAMFSMQTWVHDRRVAELGNGARLSDRIEFTLRRPLALIPGSRRLASWVIGLIFRHRHRRLVRWFGGLTP